MPQRLMNVVAANNRIKSFGQSAISSNNTNNEALFSNSYSDHRKSIANVKSLTGRRATRDFTNLDASNIEEIPYKLGSSAINRDTRSFRGFLKAFNERIVEILNFKNAMNVVFVLAISLICFQQCSTSLQDYLKYNTRVYAISRPPTILTELLPGLTVCNNNR